MRRFKPLMAKKKRPLGMVIAIDGPAGAGKSTVSKRVASALGYRYVDTGALYRCIALLAREKNVLSQNFQQGGPEDLQVKAGKMDSKLEKILDQLQEGKGIQFTFENNQHQVYLFDRNVSWLLREEANSRAASSLSERPIVRKGLLEYQRQLGREGGAVLEGRDIGTVVFPDAELKIFLMASAKVRANRRFKELQQKGKEIAFAEILASMEERDRQDSQRALAPLIPAQDAKTIDSTQLGIDQVVEKILSWAESMA